MEVPVGFGCPSFGQLGQIHQVDPNFNRALFTKGFAQSHLPYMYYTKPTIWCQKTNQFLEVLLGQFHDRGKFQQLGA